MTAVGPTNLRGRIIAVSMLMAFILYLDRICLAEIVKSASFHAQVGLTPAQIGRVLGIFFFAYAIFQVPTGWISDRFGARGTLTTYIALWSLFTACTGLVSSFPALLAARFLCGAAEAGAYPTSGALLRRWVPLASRARANSLVTVGGRLGGTLAPFLTAWLVVSLGRWRPVLWLDAAAGLAIAGLYWAVVRNRPAEHPACNPAERALIGHETDERRLSAGELGGLLRTFCVSRNLWCSALVLFFCNVGWAFLITWLPTYLKEQKHVESVAGGRMVTLVLACGLFGQLTGGWLADRATQKFGLKWGRILPLAISGALAGTGYLGCLLVGSAWSVVACCGVVSFAVDMGTPPIWAVMQDIGGRATATAIGWINMWGNFGASFISLLVPWLVAAGRSSEAGQRHVFMVCAGSLFLSGAIALGLDASKPLSAPKGLPIL
jgi:MFS family permease